MSLGYETARNASVVVLEAEALPAQHSTGRSAALFFPDYGPAAVRPFTHASRPLFAQLQQALSTPPLLAPRGALLVATSDTAADALHAWMAGSRLDPVGPQRCVELCPVLDGLRVVHGGYDPTACDIDVLALYDGYVRGLRERGGRIVYGAAVSTATHTSKGWHVTTTDGHEWSADLVVNAAGAWGDEVWARFGVHGHGLVPRRRTVAVARTPVPVDVAWPAVGDAAEGWYFKPEGDAVLVSPSDETPSVPRDEKPDPLDVAVALERVNAVTALTLRSVVTAWAGQRTFSPDGLPVIGPHPADDSLFSFVGQGGYGIQTAPALAREAAELLLTGSCTTLHPFSPQRPGLRDVAAPTVPVLPRA